MATEPTTEDIKAWLDQADAAEVEHADPLRWKAAKAIATAIAAGKTGRQLATELERSPSYVTRYKWIWEQYGRQKANRPTFRQCELESMSPDKPGKRQYNKRPKVESAQASTSHAESAGEILRREIEPLEHDLPYLLRATGDLIGLDYEEAVDAIPEDSLGVYQEWANELERWAELFIKALERRLTIEPDDDEMLTD